MLPLSKDMVMKLRIIYCLSCFLTVMAGTFVSAQDADEMEFGEFISSTRPLNKEISDKVDKQCEESAESVREYFRDQGRFMREENSGSAPCISLRSKCYDFCAQVMNGDNGGFLLSSDKQRCGYRCYDAVTACKEGDSSKTNLHLCEAKCEMLRDDNGGIIARSSREKCYNGCGFKYQ